MDPLARFRIVGDRLAPPAEALAQLVADRVVDLIVAALDMNDLLNHVDVNALLDRVDVNALLDRTEVNRLLDRVDADRLMGRVDLNPILTAIDMDDLLAQTDLGVVIAQSSGGVASNALDVVRSQAVGLDEFIARWVGRLLAALWRRRPRPPPGRASRGVTRASPRGSPPMPSTRPPAP